MLPDPDQQFVVSSITRSAIAANLTCVLQMHDITDIIPPEDPRLTDEFCTEYARRMGVCDNDLIGGCDGSAGYYDQFERDFITRLGYTPQAEPAD